MSSPVTHNCNIQFSIELYSEVSEWMNRLHKEEPDSIKQLILEGYQEAQKEIQPERVSRESLTDEEAKKLAKNFFRTMGKVAALVGPGMNK